MGEDYEYLSKLLKDSKYEVNHNIYKLQGKNAETCGRHVTLRLWNDKMTDKEYAKNYFFLRISFFMQNLEKN